MVRPSRVFSNCDHPCSSLFAKEIHFHYVVVFPYNDKENAVSSRLPKKVPEEIIKKRLRKAKQFLKKAGIKVSMP